MKRITAEMTLVRLTDDRLSDSASSMLSRLASLEERMASGIVTTASVPDSSQSPKTELSKSPEESVLTVPKVNTESATPLPSWAELLATVERTDNGAAAQLRRARGYSLGDRVIVKVADHFSVMLLDRDDIKTLLATAINLSGDMVGISAANIEIRYEKIDSEEEDPLSSLKDQE